jgi:hypothetical protein
MFIAEQHQVFYIRALFASHVRIKSFAIGLGGLNVANLSDKYAIMVHHQTVAARICTHVPGF